MILKTTWTGLQQNDPITALNLLQTLVICYEESPTSDLYDQHHSTAESEQGHPITLSVTFTHKNHTFLYDLSFLQDTITHEALYLLPQGENTDKTSNQDQDQPKQPIFIADATPGDPAPRHLRVFEDDGTENPTHVDKEVIAIMTKEEYRNVPILGIGTDFILWCGTLGKLAFKWFLSYLYLFLDAELGGTGITINMHHWPFLESIVNVIVPKFFPDILSVETRNAKYKYGLTFIHQSPDGTTYEVGYQDEPKALHDFFWKLGALLEVVYPYQTVVIDKLEDGMSPEEVQKLVDMFKPLVHKTSQLGYRIGDELMWVEG